MRSDIAALNTMKMIYLKLIQCFFSITNPLELSSNRNSSCSRWVDYVYEHDFVAELWMQVADQTSRLESVRNPYSTDRMYHEHIFVSIDNANNLLYIYICIQFKCI